FGPVVFTDAGPNFSLFDAGLNAPVLCVIQAEDLGDAITKAFGTPFAAAVGFYSRSPDNIARARRELRCEDLFINRKVTSGAVDRQPTGGLSWAGNCPPPGGPDYLREFLNARTISENVSRHGLLPTGAAEPQPVAAH